MSIEFKEGNCKRCDKVLDRYRLKDYCQDCVYIIKREEVAKKKKDNLDQLATMSIEERLAKIEEWIYDHELNHPSKELRFL